METIRCAVIGGAGYIGEHLAYYLKRRGCACTVYDIRDGGHFSYSKLDVCDRQSFASLDLSVDYIFLFTGLSGTYVGFDNYARFNAVNELGLLNLLDAIRRSDYRPKIIFPSSRLVYKGKDVPLKETDEKESKTVYAVNKLACEGLLHAYHCSFDIPYTVFRICIPYGNVLSADYSFGTIGFFIKQASSGKDITLFGGGTLKRTFTHMEDLCFQIVEGALKEASTGEIYNVGGETLTLCQAAEVVASKFGTNVTSVPWPEKDKRIESDHTYFDDAKIQALLGGFSYRRLADFSKDI